MIFEQALQRSQRGSALGREVSMRNERRNDKRHQQLNQQANLEARQVVLELHQLVRTPGKKGLSVGEMVNVAAKMGLLKAPHKSK